MIYYAFKVPMKAYFVKVKMPKMPFRPSDLQLIDQPTENLLFATLYLKVTIEKNWRSQSFEFLCLKDL